MWRPLAEPKNAASLAWIDAVNFWGHKAFFCRFAGLFPQGRQRKSRQAYESKILDSLRQAIQPAYRVKNLHPLSHSLGGFFWCNVRSFWFFLSDRGAPAIPPPHSQKSIYCKVLLVTNCQHGITRNIIANILPSCNKWHSA